MITILASIVIAIVVLWCICAIAGSARMSSLISRKEEEREAAETSERIPEGWQ